VLQVDVHDDVGSEMECIDIASDEEGDESVQVSTTIMEFFRVFK
jgi:hypothetical protein